MEDPEVRFEWMPMGKNKFKLTRALPVGGLHLLIIPASGDYAYAALPLTMVPIVDYYVTHPHKLPLRTSHSVETDLPLAPSFFLSRTEGNDVLYSSTGTHHFLNQPPRTNWKDVMDYIETHAREELMAACLAGIHILTALEQAQV